MKESIFKCKYLEDNHLCRNILIENSECADVQIKDCPQKKAYYDIGKIKYPLSTCRNCSKNGALPLRLCEDFISLKCVVKTITEKRNRKLAFLVIRPKHKLRLYLAGLGLANVNFDRSTTYGSDLDPSRVEFSMLTALYGLYTTLIFGTMYFCSVSVSWCVFSSMIQQNKTLSGMDILGSILVSLLIGFFFGGIIVFSFAGFCSNTFSSRSPYVQAYYEKCVPLPNVFLHRFLWVLFLGLYTFLLFQKYIIN